METNGKGLRPTTDLQRLTRSDQIRIVLTFVIKSIHGLCIDKKANVVEDTTLKTFFYKHFVTDITYTCEADVNYIFIHLAEFFSKVQMYSIMYNERKQLYTSYLYVVYFSRINVCLICALFRDYFRKAENRSG